MFVSRTDFPDRPSLPSILLGYSRISQISFPNGNGTTPFGSMHDWVPAICLNSFGHIARPYAARPDVSPDCGKDAITHGRRDCAAHLGCPEFLEAPCGRGRGTVGNHHHLAHPWISMSHRHRFSFGPPVYLSPGAPGGVVAATADDNLCPAACLWHVRGNGLDAAVSTGTKKLGHSCRVKRQVPHSVQRARISLYAWWVIVFAYLAAQFRPAPIEYGLPFWIAQVAILGTFLWIVIEVTNGKNWARIVLLCLFALSARSLILLLLRTSGYAIDSGIGMTALALQAVALALVFSKASAAYFRQNRT
jgi:hypothetical protein